MEKKKEIINGLIKAYWAEIETTINYIAHSVNLDGVRAEEIKKSLQAEITDELSHAQTLAKRIKELGGTVPGSMSITPDQKTLQPAKDTTDVVHVIKGVIDAEESAIKHYNKLVNDDELYESTVSITKNADTSLIAITKRMADVTDFIIELGTGFENIVANADTAIGDVKQLIKNVEKGEGVLGALLADESSYDSIKVVINNLVATTQSAAVGAQGFAENMEALKHNWLFKAYFEERGYWDKDEFEVQLDERIEEVNRKKLLLEEKIEELKELEKRVDAGKTNKE